MALRLILGVPGSGKTFYAVKHLVDTYYERVGDDYVAKEDIKIITNIDSLKLDHVSLDELLRRASADSKEAVKLFFTVERQKEIIAEFGGKVIYLIDEAQRYFHQWFKDRDVLYFFEYHRHLGLDLYIIAQNERRLSPGLRGLAESQIVALNRSTSFLGELKYKIISEGEVIDWKVLKKDKRIFGLYRSMVGKETERIKNPLLKYLAFAVLVMIGGFGIFYYTFIGSSSGKEKDKGAVGRKVSSVSSANISATGKMGDVNVKGVAADVKRWRSWSYITVGEKVFVFDSREGEFVRLDRCGYDCKIDRGYGGALRVYLLMGDTDYDKYGVSRAGADERRAVSHSAKPESVVKGVSESVK